MGGYGNERAQRRDCADDYVRLDVRWCKRRGYLRQGGPAWCIGHDGESASHLSASKLRMATSLSDTKHLRAIQNRRTTAAGGTAQPCQYRVGTPSVPALQSLTADLLRIMLIDVMICGDRATNATINTCQSGVIFLDASRLQIARQGPFATH